MGEQVLTGPQRRPSPRTARVLWTRDRGTCCSHPVCHCGNGRSVAHTVPTETNISGSHCSY